MPFRAIGSKLLLGKGAQLKGSGRKIAEALEEHFPFFLRGFLSKL
jgi:hypothetical protein